MKTRVTLIAGIPVLSLAVALAFPGTASAAQVGLKLGMNGNGGLQNAATGHLLTNDLAGAPSYVQTNWNNLGRYGQQNPNTILDAYGNTTVLGVQWDCTGIWSEAGGGNPTAQSNPDAKLMNSYDDSNGNANTVPNDGTITTGVNIFGGSTVNNNKPWMHVTNLTAWLTANGACSYDVVVYAEGDTAGRIGQYWIEAASGLGGSLTVGPNLTPFIFINGQTGFINTPAYTQVPATSSTGAAAVSGNYIVFPGLTADAILIRTEEYRPPGGTLRSPINAIQIIPHTIATPTLPYPTPPSPQTNYGGTTATFLVPAAGCSITYQWMAGAIGSGIYTNLTDGGNLWGSTTSTLTITNLVVSQTADYVLVAANGSGSVQSTPISLYVQPQIITGPVAQEMLYPGMTAHFVTTVALTGTNNAYQWYKDNVALADGPSGSGAAITGSLSTNLTIAGVGAADVGSYWLVSSNFYGMTTSIVSHLSLLAHPTVGSFAESVVTNSPLAYWRFDEVSGQVAFDNAGGLNGSYGANAIPGQPGLQSPSFPGYPGFDSTNAAFAVSANADAWVTIPALNLNTNTVTFVAWLYLNANQQNWAGILTSRHAGTQAGFNFSGNRVNELSYTWDENNGSTYGANVDIYVTNNVWTMVALVVTPTNASFYACDPAGGIRSANYGFANNSELFFGPGTIGVDDTYGAVRAMNAQIDEVAVFNHALSPTTITWLYVAGTAAGVVPPPTIERQPLPEEVYQGRPANFSVVPAGLPPFSYQWRSNGVALVNGGRVSGATNATLTIANTQPSDALNYDVVVSNNGGSVTSSVVTLTLTTPTGAAYEAAVMAAGPLAYWRLNEGSGSAYAFDFYGGFTATYGSAPPSLGVPGPVTTDFSGFENTNTAVLFSSGLAGSDVAAPPLNLNTNTVTIAAWINPSADQTTNFVGLVFQRQNLTISGLGFGNNNTHLGYNWNNTAADFNYDPGLVVPANQWSFAAVVIEPSRATLYLYNTSNQLAAAHSASHPAQAFDGTTYIGVDPFYPNNVRGFNGTMDEVSIWNRALSGDQIAALYTAASGVTVPPTIALQPVPTTIYVGKTNQLTLTAAGTGPYSYQWYTNGVQLNDSSDIVGSTSNVLSFTNAALIDTANYSCVVTTALGRATSSVVAVTVLPVADSPVFTVSGNNGASFLNLTNQSGIVVGSEDFGATEYSFTVTNGTLVTTYDFKVDGSVASVTGNGTGTGALNGTGTFGYSSGNSNFDNVLGEFSLDGGPKTLTIKGLIPGRSYAVQMFPLDDRDSSGGQHREQSRRAYFQDPFNLTNLSSTFFMSNNVYVKATFTAAATNQTLIQQLPGWANGFTDLGNGNLNALVVRDTSTTPAIQFQPLSTTRYVRFPVTFNATVYGPAPIGYQWQKGTGGVFTNLSNSGTLTTPFPTNLSLAFPSVATTDAADYRLVLTNTSGGTTSQVATLTVLPWPGSGSYEYGLLSYDPLAYWQLDETAGALVAYEYAGGYNGVYQAFATNGLPGVPTPPFTGFPANNHAFEVTVGQTNSWVTVPALNFNTNTVTFTAWVYPAANVNISTQADWAGIFMTRSGIAAGIGLGGASQTNAGMLAYTWNGNSGATYGFISGLVIPSNEWSFVAVAISPTNAAFYLINAEGTQTTNNPIAHSSQNWNGPANIGDDPNGNQTVARTFNGLVDEVAVFARTLSSADITGIYNASPLAPPASAPTGLTATPGDAQVTLSWSGVAEAAGYNIKRSTTSGSGYTTVANVGGTTFVNTNLLNGTNYFFVVSAVNFAGEGPNSTQASARPTSSTPPQVVFGVNGQQIQLSWPGDHTGWLLQEQTNSTGGLGTNWVIVPGSDTNNVFTVPINTSQASAFFRLVHP